MAVVLALTLAACGPPGTAGDGADDVVGPLDAGAVGGLDGATGDGTDVQEGGEDAQLVDGATSDAAPPDVGPADVAPPDAGPADVALPDAGGSDAGGDAGTADAGCTPAPPAAGPGLNGTCKTALGCSLGEGCHDGACGACVTADDCRERAGCSAEGACGRCETDGACRGGEFCSHGYCVPKSLQIWEIVVASEDWSTFWADPYAENLVPCTLAVDGVYYEGCQVRIRGGSSVDLPKKSFRVELPSASPTPGYSNRINLRAEYNDPSYLHNLLATETISRLTRIPAPRVRPVRVLLNGSDHGVMMEVERMADPFLTARGWKKDQQLVEADPSTLASKGVCSLVPLTPKSLYATSFDAKDNGATGTMEALVSLVEDVIWKDYEDRVAGAPHPVRTNAAVDMEMLADYVAVLALLQSTDHLRKNYYLSRQPEQGISRWIMLPWDLDMTFGCLWSEAHETLCVDMVTKSPWTAGALSEGGEAGYPVQGLYNLLIDLAIKDAVWGKRIRDSVCSMIDDPVWTEDIPDMSLALEEALAPDVAKDDGDRNETIDDFHAATAMVRTFAEERRAFLRQTLGCGACGAADF